jgi:hypothetical protein
VISLSEQTLLLLLAQGSAQVIAAPSATDAPDGKSAKELLARASAVDLAEANRRYAILLASRASGWNPELGVSRRTLRRWKAKVRQAEAVHQCGYAGILPQKTHSGNRNQKLPEETRKLMEELIDKEYEDARQPTRFAVWSKLHQECEARSLPAPSYQTFCSYVDRRPRCEQLKNMRSMTRSITRRSAKARAKPFSSRRRSRGRGFIGPFTITPAAPAARKAPGHHGASPGELPVERRGRRTDLATAPARCGGAALKGTSEHPGADVRSCSTCANSRADIR